MIDFVIPIKSTVWSYFNYNIFAIIYYECK